MNFARISIKWERIQHGVGQDLDPLEMQRLDASVAAAEAAGLTVLIDIHNYDRFYTDIVGSSAVPNSAFADLWRRLAIHYGSDSDVMFGLMNEPHTVAPTDWRASAVAALGAIRATGARNTVLVPGTNWTGAENWTVPVGSSNAEALADLRDPANAMLVEMHLYFDSDSSGTHFTCVSAEIGAERLQAATDWLRQTGHLGFLGEFGASSDPTCMAALDTTLAFLQANSDVWVGWTYWATGKWWGSYPFSVQPNADGTQKPQTAVLQRYAVGKSPPAAAPVSANLPLAQASRPGEAKPLLELRGAAAGLPDG